MEAQVKTFERVSAMPASTWHFLKANDATIQIPDQLAIAPDVRISGTYATCDDAEAFAHAIDRVQKQWEVEHPAPTAEELAEREAYRAAESDATYGGTAQSAYQAHADALEDARSLMTAFEHGTGDETAMFLRSSAGRCAVVQASQNEAVEASVIVTGTNGTISVSALDIVAMRGSSVDVHVVVDGRIEEDYDGEEISGFAGTTIRVFADEDARVRITRTQTLSGGFIDVDDMGLFAHERATIEVRQTVLGASSTYTGLAGDLRGDSARVDVDTRYLGHDTQSHDFNYMLRHHGTRTRCNLNANGVLAGKSRKTLRGTIDLIRGCKGAEGSENENVLLVDEGVTNKTVPVILCNEDDVAGNHGATIGHIREEQLFYLESRGIPREAAEAMFVSAMFEQAVIDAPDEDSRAAVLRLGGDLIRDFCELFD